MKNLNRLFLLMLIAPVTFAFYGCDDDETVYGDWIRASDFSGVARSDAASFVIGSKGYVFGGYDGDDRLNDLWEFTTTSSGGTWTQLGLVNAPPVRNSASAFAIGNKGYIGLGYDGDDYMTDFWEYNVDTDTWTEKAPFEGGKRNGAIAFALNGLGYMGSGFNDNYLKDFYEYNPASNTWSQITDIGGSKRYNGTAFIYKNEAYIIGGVNNLAVVNDFWKFNPTSKEWIQLNYINDRTDNDWDDDYTNIARQYPLVFVIDEKAYMTCGSNRSGSLLSDTWAYDFAVDRWDDAPGFEGTTRTAAVAFSMDNRGFILTGRSSSYRFDDVWEFLPGAEYDTQTN